MRLLIFLLSVSCFAQNSGFRLSVESQSSQVIAETLTSTTLAADEYGFRVWSWEDTLLPNTDNDGSVYFSDDHLKTSFECNPDIAAKVPGQNLLKITVTPSSPAPRDWCSNAYNLRGEIGTQPASVQYPEGTESWQGFKYIFGTSYQIDVESKWLFWQNYNTVSGGSPLLSLTVNATNGGYTAGEIMLVNASQPVGVSGNTIHGTGVVPVADDELDIVIHTIWGDEATGLIQVWINDVLVVDEQERTVRAATPFGGHDKWGQYCSPWRDGGNVSASAADGITERVTYLGPVRQHIKSPSDPTNGDDIYDTVAP